MLFIDFKNAYDCIHRESSLCIGTRAILSPPKISQLHNSKHYAYGNKGTVKKFLIRGQQNQDKWMCYRRFYMSTKRCGSKL